MHLRPIQLIAASALALSGLAQSVAAGQDATQDVRVIGQAFADNCFSPYLTAEKARDAIAPTGGRVDFYDLRPFSSAAPSPVTGAPATDGTDRRCEVAFDGAQPALAADWIGIGLKQEGLSDRLTQVPEGFAKQTGTTFIGAAQLNPNRIAIVQSGVRTGPNGPETFMSVERMTPLDGT